MSNPYNSTSLRARRLPTDTLPSKRIKTENAEIKTVGPFTETESQRKLNKQLEVLYDELGFKDFIVVGSVALMIHCFASNLNDKSDCLDYDIGDIDMVTHQGYNTILEQQRYKNDRLFILPKTNIKIKGKDRLDFDFPFHKGISLKYKKKNDLEFEFDYIKLARNLPPIDMYYQFSENPEKKVGIVSFKKLKLEYKEAEEEIDMLKNEKKDKLRTKLQILNELEKQQQSGGKRSVKKSKKQKKTKRRNSIKKQRRTKKKKPSNN